MKENHPISKKWVTHVSEKRDVEKEKLKEFNKWFKRYIRREYGEKCDSFSWECAACHANFVKEILDDFIALIIMLSEAEEKDAKMQKGVKTNEDRNK